MLTVRACLFLAGPTAVGKTEISLLLAERLNGEIVSVDSMQVYRGMDVGTAKPGGSERHRVPHHLLDVMEVNQPFDAAQFATLAHQAVGQITAGGRLPLLVGGTGLYFQALLRGLGHAPPADPALRQELRRISPAVLLQELAEKDPATFARIDQRNPRRVIRAVEVIRLTGKPFSEQRASWQDTPGPMPFFGLDRPKAELQTRINARVEEMFRSGLVEETRQLLARGLAENPIALQALGYRQVVEYLDGVRSLPETVELVKLRTRQFAKRQLTWFRRQAGIHWLTLLPGQSSQEIADTIAQLWKKRLEAGDPRT